MTMRNALIVSALIFLGGCGGGGSPASPTPPVTAPTINTATDMVFIGQTVQFAATGSGTITWGGDQSAVATVDGPTGRVTGVATGRVTIWAENAGGRTTRLLRVLPSFAGTWRGNYALTGCQSTGDFARGGFCGVFFQGQILTIGFDMLQDRDRVTGRFALGNLEGDLDAGTVSELGVLPITGRINSADAFIVLENLRAESQSAGTMTGTFEQTWGAPSLTGTGRLSCEIRSLTRQSGGPTLLLARPGRGDLTLDDMIRLAIGRS